MKIYGDPVSGNCYKIQLTCSLLGIDYDWIPIDVLAGETQTPTFLRKSPNGKIPLLELDSGETLAESNAIINYLSVGSHLLPENAFQLAKAQQWQFFEQYSHEPYIAVRRFIQIYQGLPENRLVEYEAKKAGGEKALWIMDQQLQKTAFLVGEKISVADIALFAYTHVANEGGFDLADYPSIEAWLKRIKGQPNFKPMGT
ncbi:glutathione S-transferase family protein [Teredinibacter haidensis]|uniref:glutathione S-transferase family protein n=1 Tax=Teredinibacter haidensis TaxID=2731755 RepID=UPI000948A1BA|nr:glutathione S-transferase family protein [Teredinibacter haidensis]